jgi:parallel beta-helix repeat protein
MAMLRPQGIYQSRSAQTLLALLLALPMVQGVATPLMAAEAVRAAGPEPIASTLPSNARILHVNPAMGADTAPSGSQRAPFRTIAYALSQAQPGDVVQLAPGIYSATTGETFPLMVPEGVTLRGDEAAEGKNTVIQGGGSFISPSFARQNAAVRVQRNTVLSGITVTNGNTRGTGVWVESANPVIRRSVFKGNHRDGIFVTGNAAPMIQNCLFHENKGNGIALTRAAGGEIRDSWFQATGFGLAIGGTANPLVVNNTIVNNQDGVVISDQARPVLRNNSIENNGRDGIVAILRARPDLGTSTAPGNNRIMGNGRFAVNNATGNAFSTIGNQMGRSRVFGL